MPTQWKITIAWDGTNYIDEGSISQSPFQSNRGRENLIDGTTWEEMQPGTCSFTLPNINGRFDPYNSSSPIYANLKPARPVKVNAYDLSDSADNYVFTGILSDFQPIAGENLVAFDVSDPLQWLADQDISITEMDNTTIHLAIDAALTAAGYPFATSIDACTQPVYIFDPDKSKALDVIRDLERASMGTFFIKADGTACFYALNTSAGDTYDLDQADLLKDIKVSQPWEQVCNTVIVTATRRGMLALSPIWTGGGMQLVDNVGIDVDITFDASTAVYVPAVKLVANTAADGSGTDISSHVGVTVTLLTKTSAHLYIYPIDDGYLLILEVWGQKYVETPYVSKASDATSIAAYGPKLFELESPWLQDSGYANAFAALILAQYKDPTKGVAVHIKGHPDTQYAYDLMDNIHLTSAKLGIDDTFRIGGRVDEWQDTENGQSVLTTLYLQRVIYSAAAITPDPYSPAVPPTVSPQTPPVVPGGGEPTGKTFQIYSNPFDIVALATTPATAIHLDLNDFVIVYNSEATTWVDANGDIVLPEVGIYKIEIDAGMTITSHNPATNVVGDFNFTVHNLTYGGGAIYAENVIYFRITMVGVSAGPTYEIRYYPDALESEATKHQIISGFGSIIPMEFYADIGGYGIPAGADGKVMITITQLLDASALVGAPGADGADGTNGTNGTNGVGVPTGGATAEVLEKIDGTNYNTQWSTRTKRSGSTADNHLAVWNGANADSLKDGGAVPSAGVARSGSTTDNHLAVWNGSSADSIKDGGAVPSGGISAGTSFPGSPSAGDLYFRTDLGLICFYSAAAGAWLTCNEYTWDFPAQTITAYTARLAEGSYRGDYFIWATRIHLNWYVATTNDASHYWIGGIVYSAAGGLGFNDTTVGNSSTFSPDTDTPVDTVLGYKVDDDGPPATKLTQLWVGFGKSSTPGALTISGTFYYRLIIT